MLRLRTLPTRGLQIRPTAFRGLRFYSDNVPGTHEDARAAIINQQAPNRTTTWAPSQRPRSEAMTGPRFEQADLTLQPRPYAAIDLIAQQPVRYVSGHKAVCDGEKGPQQGHPRIYINVDKPGAHACLYCGLRYANTKYRADIEGANEDK